MKTNTRKTLSIRPPWFGPRAIALVVASAFFAPVLSADKKEEKEEDEEEPLGAAVVIIELTDNDIELQVFADAFDWTRLKIFDPKERLVFETKSRGRLKRQGGMSEIAFASEPSHYLVEEDDYDEDVEDFLKRWPEGHYEFEAVRTRGLGPLESEAYLSHKLAALPEVTSPEEDAVVPHDEPLLISWTDVDGTSFIEGATPAEVVEYQVIVGQETPGRAAPWIDGDTRRTLMNLPATVTSVKIPAEILEPGATYEIEILAIEKGGNASIGVLPFETEEAEEE